MRKDAKKPRKGNRTKKVAVKDLTVKDAKAVKGGKEYLQVKFNDIIITS